MVRRSNIRRYPDGTPYPVDRCRAEVIDKLELFPRQCLKARLRGLAFCETHRDVLRLESFEARVDGSYDDEIDEAARALIPILDRLTKQ
jgi:hypothetical protein